MDKKEKTEGLPYDIGGSDRQKWMNKYFFAPRGMGFLEPGIVPLDHPAMSAYNITKSAYQIRPDVFNLDFVAKETGLKKEEIATRISRLYDEHLILFIINPATQVYGWGLYYWIVKLKEGTPESVKAEFSEWYQNKDEICTGFETKGDFDFFNGNHMRVIDNLYSGVINPLGTRPEVEYVHLTPIRRDVREDRINMWDAGEDGYREYLFTDDEINRLVKFQSKVDLKDLKIVRALNKKRPIEDYFNFKALAEVSGLEIEDMKAGIRSLVEEKKIVVPLVFLNWPKLGLTQRMFLIRLFQIIPCYRKAEIVDEFTKVPEFNQVMEFSDSFYDIALWACNETTDIDKLRKKIEDYGEVEEIKESDVTRQYRRWVCRLDDNHGFWEECVFTDDFLQDFAKEKRCQL